MKWYASSIIRYLLPASIFTGWTILMWYQQSLIPRIEVVIGFLSLLLLVVIIQKGDDKTSIFWDASTGILGVLKRWTVDVTALRLLRSVPLGIDLTHSGERVLEAMASYYGPSGNGELRFFVVRPLGMDSTRVGFAVRRTGLRMFNGISTISKLGEELLVDVEVLESAMRASYPHVAVTNAGLEETRFVESGGIAVVHH